MKEIIDVEGFQKDDIKKAAGCTEIVAVGLSTAIAYNALVGNLPKSIGNGKNEFQYPDAQKLEKIEVKVSKNIFKNACGVAIPNTNGKKGIPLAAILGIYLDINKYFKSKEEPEYLKIFEQIKSKILEDAEEQVSKVSSDLVSPNDYSEIPSEEKDKSNRGLYISAEIKYDNHYAKAVLYKKHDRPYFIKVDEEIIPIEEEGEKREKVTQPKFTIERIINTVENITGENKKRIQDTIDVNKLLVEEGLLESYSMGIVGIFKDCLREGILSDDLTMQIKLQVAAAVEARMGGSPKPAMTASGSGNMGITATVPIIVVGEKLNKPKDRLLRAILMSQLMVRAVSDHIGELSALCGNINKSAFGAAAGLTYMLGGGQKEIENAINAVASNTAGVFCDGAKYGCALKAITAATVAWDAALLSMRGLEVPADGIVESSADDTLENFKKLSEATIDVDDVIVDIIIDRNKRGSTS